MRQFHDKKYKLENKKVLLTKPSRLIIRTLTENSLSDRFGEAKHEWEYSRPILSDSEDFVENCELCHHRNHKKNYLIFNPNTNRYLKVGSDCIRRFIIFSGTNFQEDSNTFFAQKEKEIEIEFKLRELFSSVVEEKIPLARDLNHFRTLLIKLLDARGQLPLAKTVDGSRSLLVKLFKKDDPIPFEERLLTILNEPILIVTQKETKRFRNLTIKEGETWLRKNKKTGTTLSPSGAYRPDEKYRYKK